MQITSIQRIENKFKERYLISLSTKEAAKKTAETLGVQEEEVLQVIQKMATQEKFS